MSRLNDGYQDILSMMSPNRVNSCNYYYDPDQPIKKKHYKKVKTKRRKKNR